MVRAGLTGLPFDNGNYLFSFLIDHCHVLASTADALTHVHLKDL